MAIYSCLPSHLSSSFINFIGTEIHQWWANDNLNLMTCTCISNGLGSLKKLCYYNAYCLHCLYCLLSTANEFENLSVESKYALERNFVTKEDYGGKMSNLCKFCSFCEGQMTADAFANPATAFLLGFLDLKITQNLVHSSHFDLM